jgi:CubicO group peptidase (beta-lactamase class C family)
MNLLPLCLLLPFVASATSCLARDYNNSTAIQSLKECESMSVRESQIVESVRAKYSLPAMGGASLAQGCVNFVDVSGVRYLGSSERVTKTDSWHLGSNTKAMTAALIAMLIEEKKFNWDTCISELLGDVKLDPSYSRTTVEMLLAHQGGAPEDLSSFENGKLWEELFNPALDVREGRTLVAKRVLGVPSQYEPGAKYGYSNAGYIILGHIIERAVGVSWEEHMRKRLFGPLAMTSCSFGSTNRNDPWGHSLNDDGRTFVAIEPGFFADNPPTLGPAGTVRCSLFDYAKFLQWNIDGLRGRATLLSEISFKKLHSPFSNENAYSRGGWRVLERGWAHGFASTHSGSNTVNLVTAWLAPEIEKAFVATTNAYSDAAWKAVDEVISDMAKP